MNNYKNKIVQKTKKNNAKKVNQKNKKKFKCFLIKQQKKNCQFNNKIKLTNLNNNNLLLNEQPHTSTKNYYDKKLLNNNNNNFLQKFTTKNNILLIGKQFSKTIAKVMFDVAFVASNSLLGINALPSMFNHNYEDEFKRVKNQNKQRNSVKMNEIDSLYFYNKNNNQVQKQPETLVHTFGTYESCARICPLQCTAQELEDLAMMQRWICTTKVIYLILNFK